MLGCPERRGQSPFLPRPSRFDQICREHGIKHRLTKPNQPWTNGYVVWMNRSIKNATVKRYHCDTPYEYVARI